MTSFRIIGAGRAGLSLDGALRQIGWQGRALLTRGAPLAGAAADVDYLVIATPDAEITRVSHAVEPSSTATLVHLAGSLGPEALGAHHRTAAIHPLLSLTDPHRGAALLLSGAWFGVTAGPPAMPAASSMVEALSGHLMEIAPERRNLYHAAACVASNHLVALMAQAERLAAEAGLPFEALLSLVESSVTNVTALGARRALTGPVARGDWVTVASHLDALAPGERGLYEALAAAAASLAGRDWPPPRL